MAIRSKSRPAAKVGAGRAAELRAKIEDANYRYHVLDDPTLADATYDALLRELIDLEEAQPDLPDADGRFPGETGVL